MINLLSVLRKDCYQKDLSSEAVEEASFTCPTDAFANSFLKNASIAPPQQLHPAPTRHVPTEPVAGSHANALALRYSPERFGEATGTH